MRKIFKENILLTGLNNSENTKSEIFSIGATILSAGLLKNFNGIYKKNIFDNNGLTELKD